MPTTADLDQNSGCGRRRVQLLVLSDVHLGSRSCRAQELLDYLDRIEPREVILNGDILDLWAGGSWPESHRRILRCFSSWAACGIPVTFIPGNHDEALRLLAPCVFAGIAIELEAERMLGGLRTLFIHGDLEERHAATPRWMSCVATIIYDLAMAMQGWCNEVLPWLGLKRVGIVQKAARTLPFARGHVRDFEARCRRTAKDRGFQAVVVGHIHHARMLKHDDALYLNSGDWVESMTALEFDGKRWRIVSHQGEPAWQPGPLPVLAAG
jgi:UDP-2,3-diacylglucosamine pyrophosphatase LpxH